MVLPSVMGGVVHYPLVDETEETLKTQSVTVHTSIH